MSQKMRDLRKKIINVKLRSPNKTHQEIADAYGVTRSDISHRISVIRKKLKKFLF